MTKPKKASFLLLKVYVYVIIHHSLRKGGGGENEC